MRMPVVGASGLNASAPKGDERNASSNPAGTGPEPGRAPGPPGRPFARCQSLPAAGVAGRFTAPLAAGRELPFPFAYPFRFAPAAMAPGPATGPAPRPVQPPAAPVPVPVPVSAPAPPADSAAGTSSKMRVP